MILLTERVSKCASICTDIKFQYICDVLFSLRDSITNILKFDHVASRDESAAEINLLTRGIQMPYPQQDTVWEQ